MAAGGVPRVQREAGTELVLASSLAPVFERTARGADRQLLAATAAREAADALRKAVFCPDGRVLKVELEAAVLGDWEAAQ